MTGRPDGASPTDAPPVPPARQSPRESASRRPSVDGLRWIPALVTLVAVATVVLLPLRVVGIGFRPPDDARRHAAKVIADKPWDELLVLRPEVTVDPHPGWHAVLGAAHGAGIRGAMGLVLLPVVGLGALFLALPLLLRLARAEAWLLALLVTAVTSWPFFGRIFLGRPFVVTMCALVVLCAIWPRLREERLARGAWSTLTGLVALAVWIHGNWYLWLLPLAAFVFAGAPRVGRRFAGAVVVGTALGAIATGSPVAFLTQTLRHPLWALAGDLPARFLVGEFQPFDGEPLFVAAMLALVARRAVQRREATPLREDPVFLLAAAGWALGFHTQRFFSDWGMPAALVWMAKELDVPFATMARGSRQRLLVTTLLAAVLVLAVTNDRQGRWSSAERSPFLSLDNPVHRAWLPAPGGVLYSNRMQVFYDTFWRNPRAPWRYAVGFEPALMPPADLAVFRAIQLERSSDAAFAPWVAKMRAEDRLVIVRPGAESPRIARLEWYSPYRGMWIGRLPASGAASAPTTSGEPADAIEAAYEGNGHAAGDVAPD